MKIALFFLLIGSFIDPVVFRGAKSISSDSSEVLAVIDATKYQQLRLGIASDAPNADCSVQPKKDNLEVELRIAEREYRRIEALLKDGIVAQSEFDEARRRLESARASLNVKRRNFPCPFISILGVDGETEIPLATVSLKEPKTSVLLDAPPAKIVVRGYGEAKYTIVAWGH